MHIRVHGTSSAQKVGRSIKQEVWVVEFDPGESSIRSLGLGPGGQVERHDLPGLIAGGVGPAVVAHAPEIDHESPDRAPRLTAFDVPRCADAIASRYGTEPGRGTSAMAWIRPRTTRRETGRRRRARRFGRGRSRLGQGDRLPVSHGEFSNRELPDQHPNAVEPALAARQFLGERLPGGVGSGIVLGDPSIGRCIARLSCSANPAASPQFISGIE